MTIFNLIVYSSYANRCKIAESSRLSSHIFKSNLRAMRNYCGADFIAKCSMNNSDARWLSPCILIFRDYVFPYFEENPATHQHKNLKTYLRLKTVFLWFRSPNWQDVVMPNGRCRRRPMGCRPAPGRPAKTSGEAPPHSREGRLDLFGKYGTRCGRTVRIPSSPLRYSRPLVGS